MDREAIKMAEEILFAKEERPSFAKRLNFGLFDNSKVLPYPQPPLDEYDQTETLCRELEEFARCEINAEQIDRDGALPDRVIQGLGKRGILGLTLPKKYGGLGLSQHAYCRVEELLASHCGSTALFVNAHQSIGLKALLLFGTEQQKERWLPSLATGESIAAFSLTEPNAGSDAAAIEARATYDPEKRVYRINGCKQWTTNGAIADVLTVMAQTEVETPKGKQDKVTAFLVTPDMPGFQVTAARLEKVGMRGTATSNLAFDNLEVPEENVLGPLGGGLRVALTCLDYGRTTFGATCTGTAKVLLKAAIEHARNRIQFKKPLAAFPLIKQKIAFIASYTYAMEATTYLTAGLIDGRQEDVMIETAALKIFASEALWQIIYETMQIYGGLSFFTDTPLERMMRDARLNTIGEGANEVLRLFTGVAGMRQVGLELKGLVDQMKQPLKWGATLAKFAAGQLGRLKPPHIAVESPRLRQEAVRLSRAARQYGWMVQRLLVTHREEIIDQQFQLNRMATAMISLYTTTAVLSRLDSEIRQNHPNLDDHLAMGRYYCMEAFRRFDGALATLFHNHNDQTEQLSDQLTHYEFTPRADTRATPS